MPASSASIGFLKDQLLFIEPTVYSFLDGLSVPVQLPLDLSRLTAAPDISVSNPPVLTVYLLWGGTTISGACGLVLVGAPLEAPI